MYGRNDGYGRRHQIIHIINQSAPCRKVGSINKQMANNYKASAPQGGDNAQRNGGFNQGTQSNHISSSTTKDFPVALTVAGGAGVVIRYAQWMSGKSDEQRKTGWKILGILGGGCLAIYGATKGFDFLLKKLERIAEDESYKTRRKADIEKECAIIEAKINAKIRKMEAESAIKAAAKNAQKEDNQATHSEQLVAEGQSPSQVPSMTGAEIKAAAKNAPKPQFLLDGIIKEGSICMLLAPEKIGKSTFVMQLVDALSKGETFCLPVNQYKNTPTDVIYYDFELDRDDYADRYGNSSTMDKIELVRKKDWVSIDAWLSDIEEKVSASTKNKVIVVDTMSSIVGNDDESAKVINRRIKALKDTMASKGIFISFIFICHTIKDYESWKPITAKDIRGSQLLTGLADTTLALEPTKWGNNHIMFKQIDSRKTGLEEQAFLLERINEPGNWHFCFKKMVNEQENLPNKNGRNESTMQEQGTKESIEERNARWQKKYDEGMSCNEIAKEAGVSRQTVSNNINKWRGKGRKNVENKDCNGQGTE